MAESFIRQANGVARREKGTRVWERGSVHAATEQSLMGSPRKRNKRARGRFYGGMFSAAKDAIASKAAQSFLNQRIARYGEVRTLKLDSKNKSGEVVCALHGEPEPIVVRVERYEVTQRGGQTYVKLAQCSANRPWLQNLLMDYGVDREVPVPPWAASAL